MTLLPTRPTVLAAGIALGLTLAIVPSASAQNLANCGTADSRTDSSVGINYTTNHEVVGDGTVAPGGTVTLRTKVSSNSGVGAVVSEIRQYHPEGFTPVSARVESHKARLFGSGHSWVTEKVVRDIPNDVAKVQGGGWTTGLGQRYVTAEFTYRAPENVSPGQKFETGAGFNMVAATNRTYDPMNVCITVRERNAVEAATGSLEGVGAGSLTEGSTTSTTLSSDPSSLITEIVNGLDIGQLIGGIAGS